MVKNKGFWRSVNTVYKNECQCERRELKYFISYHNFSSLILQEHTGSRKKVN